MSQYIKSIEIRWSDLDPNFHLRHSVYYDWGAYCRMCFLVENGLTPERLQQEHTGPILFREECQFRKEVHFGDAITITMELIHARQDFSRWAIQHRILKDQETLAAIITVEGAWIDTQKRKLMIAPEIARSVFGQMPLHASFEWKNKWFLNKFLGHSGVVIG